MPPKSRMSSKCSNKNKKCNEESYALSKTTTDVSNTSGLNPEAENQFELELCWCIQQLEATLASGKLQQKQAQDLNKHLRSLKSNTAPLIKKRQIMRNTLGDYKDKMTEDEQKLNKIVSNVKFINPTAVNKKSVFIKKAVRHSEQKQEEGQTNNHRTQETLASAKQIINIDKTQVPFQFNFQTCQ